MVNIDQLSEEEAQTKQTNQTKKSTTKSTRRIEKGK